MWLTIIGRSIWPQVSAYNKKCIPHISYFLTDERSCQISSYFCNVNTILINSIQIFACLAVLPIFLEFIPIKALIVLCDFIISFVFFCYLLDEKRRDEFKATEIIEKFWINSLFYSPKHILFDKYTGLSVQRTAWMQNCSGKFLYISLYPWIFIQKMNFQ